MIELFYSQFDSTKLKPKNNVPDSMKTSLPVRLQFSKTSFFTSANFFTLLRNVNKLICFSFLCNEKYVLMNVNLFALKINKSQ